MDQEEQQQAVQAESVESTEDTTRPVPEESVPSVADTLREAASLPETAPSTPNDQEGGDDTERKPTRIERRNADLVDKLKQATQSRETPDVYGNEPIFTPEEIESGSFDPAALQQRLENKMAQNAQVVERQVMARLEYNNQVNQHLADIDSVQKELGEDPILDKLVAKQYEALNNQTDPRTGTKIFVPQVKMSEIYKELKEALDKKTVAATANVQARVNESANNQAVPVSVSNSTSSTDMESQATLEKALQTGTTEDWAEVLKKKFKSKA